jgi:uncharacterized protein (TIGR02145 family)
MLIISCKKDASKQVPSLTAAAAINIASTSASSGGSITSDGGATVTARGVCWSNNHNPTIADNKTSDGTGTGSFVSAITGLTPGLVYYIRAYATNSVGTAYSNETQFSTPVLTVTDIDGNVYHMVTIGTQTWMVENLKTTKYNDGTPITLITDDAIWRTYSTPGYCWYNNNISNKDIYGALYNWFAVNTGKLCPVGWHVPTDAEFTILFNYLGGFNVAAGKLKESGTTHWLTPNTGATNETGFTALPGECRNTSGPFDLTPGYYGYWWSSTELNYPQAFAINMTYTAGGVARGNYTELFGFSVRCIKN